LVGIKAKKAKWLKASGFNNGALCVVVSWPSTCFLVVVYCHWPLAAGCMPNRSSSLPKSFDLAQSGVYVLCSH